MSSKPVIRGLEVLLSSAAVLVLAAAPVAAQSAGPERLELSLTEAMRLAFENNLDIRVVSFQSRIAAEQVRTAEGAFQPSFSVGLPGAGNFLSPVVSAFGGASGAGGFGFSDQRAPASTVLAGADVSTSNSLAALTNFGQSLPFGFRYDVSYSLTRSTTNSFFQSLNPSWDNTLAVTVSQPLLRGRGEEAAAAQLLLARANTSVSEAAFAAQVQEVLLAVERAYWQLVFAERDLEVKTSSQALAVEQLERTTVQVEVGLIAPVQATQAEVQVASRETEVIVARNAVDNARDALRAVLGAERLPRGWDTELVAVDEPTVELDDVSLELAIATAMQQRPEIQQARAAIAARAVEVAANRNGLLPRVDLVGQLLTTGIGGDLNVREGFGGPVTEVVPGGYGDAIRQLTGLGYMSWRLGVNVAVPIGNDAAEGAYAQATLGEDQARTELERVRQQVVLEVRQAERGLRAAADAVASTRKTRELAERQLEIEVDRFEVGISTNFEVLQFQDQLAAARSAELQAMIAHRQAETDLRRAMGTLLGRYGLSVQ